MAKKLTEILGQVVLPSVGKGVIAYPLAAGLKTITEKQGDFGYYLRDKNIIGLALGIAIGFCIWEIGKLIYQSVIERDK